jgi:hypothetical protein
MEEQILLSSVFTDDVLNQFDTKIAEIRKKKVKGFFNETILLAYEDILSCIKNESIKTDEDLEEYIETHYFEPEDNYFIIVALIAYTDGEFDSVDDMFNFNKDDNDDDILEGDSIMDFDDVEDFDDDDEY